VASDNWYDRDMARFRVEIAKSQDGGHWETIAKGTWEQGSDPVLKGESVTQAVLEDLLRIDPAGQESGISHAQARYIRYKMAFFST
jgi:hypothetical protein